MLYEATDSLWIFPASVTIISTFWGIIKVTCFLLTAVTSLLNVQSFETIILALWAQNGSVSPKRKSQNQYLQWKLQMAELLVFGLLSSTAELSRMPNYQVPVKGIVLYTPS